MEFIDLHSSFSEIFNFVLDKLVAIAFWAWLAWTILRNTRANIAKEGIGKGLYMGVVVTLEAGVLVSLIYYPLPQFLVYLSRHTLDLATVRWVIIYAAGLVWSYRVSYKTSGWRGIAFTFITLTIIFFGWLYDRWLGIFAMSVPILLIHLFIIHKVAQIILPASDPEDREEKRNKTRAFLVYLFGVQHPIWQAKAKVGRDFEKQLEGNSNAIGKPGIIWTWSHQVAGITKGVGSNRVDGPGLIFIAPFETPMTLIDLRMQSRVCTVLAITKDGIEIPAVVFSAFVIDKEQASISRPSKRKPANGGDLNIDHPDGSFPYSSGRVLLTLGATGINNPRQGESEEKIELFWDEWVMKQIKHVTRLVVAERNLDELWRPKHDGLGVSALDEIAARLKDLLTPQLTEVGVNLITARIVNYQLPQIHPVVEQNIKTWSSYWEQQITEANADIDMIRREEIEKAHAYAKSILLSAIADSITRARRINEALPRHVIAQYYIHALEEYIRIQPGPDSSDPKKRIESIRNFLLENGMEGSE